MMNKWFFSIVSLIIISNPLTFTYADSSRVIIPVEDDVFVDKSEFFNPQSQSLMIGFGGTRTEWVLYDDLPVKKPRVYSSDILPVTSYLKFNLNSIPSSDLFDTVNIDDARLRLFFVSPDNSDAKMYVVTVSSCKEKNWTEKDLTWDTRPCQNNLQPVDTIIIDEDEIPGLIELDVVGAIDRFKDEKNAKITLVIDARPFLFDVDSSDRDCEPQRKSDS